MISILIWLLILILVFGVLYAAISMVPLPPPFHQIALLVLAVVFVLIVLIWLLPLVGHGPPIGSLR